QQIITDPSTQGTDDILLARFNANEQRIWGTYFGKSGTDHAFSLTADVAGNIYIAGFTRSSSGITTTGVYQESFGGFQDGLLAKFNGSGNLSWASYYGGSDDDYCSSIAFDP